MISLHSVDAKHGDFREKFSEELVTSLSKHPDIQTVQLVTHYVYAMQMKYHSYLIAIIPSKDTAFSQENAIYNKWTEELNKVLVDKELPFIESFAKAKYALDQMFLSITKKGILEYTYSSKALLASHQLKVELSVSKATISRYVALGMETVNGVGHHRYPLHNAFYWKDGVWASRIQALYQAYHLRNRTTEDVIKELKDEIKGFEDSYNGTFKEIFGHVKDPYELDEPDDYLNWRNALEELSKKQSESLKP